MILAIEPVCGVLHYVMRTVVKLRSGPSLIVCAAVADDAGDTERAREIITALRRQADRLVADSTKTDTAITAMIDRVLLSPPL